MSKIKTEAGPDAELVLPAAPGGPITADLDDYFVGKDNVRFVVLDTSVRIDHDLGETTWIFNAAGDYKLQGTIEVDPQDRLVARIYPGTTVTVVTPADAPVGRDGVSLWRDVKGTTETDYRLALQGLWVDPPSEGEE